MRAVDLACTPRSEGIPVPGLARLHEDIPAWNCLRREQLRVGAESWDVVREQHKALVQLASRVRVTHTFGVCKTGDEKVGVTALAMGRRRSAGRARRARSKSFGRG